MKRFDRAVYAMFLLVLLADVARSHASVPVSGDQAGNLILTAAAQLGTGNSGGAILAVRRADGSLAPIARWRRSSLSLPAWSRIVARSNSASVSSSSHLVLLATSSIQREAVADSPLTPAGSGSASSLAIFAHTLSPAP